MGHAIDQSGLRPTAEKVRALKEAKLPSNVSELRPFIEIITYY